MKSKLTLFTLLLFALSLKAQESIQASGGDALGSGGSSSYSIGQAIYSSYVDSGGSMTEGVQQAFEEQTLNVSELDSNGIVSVYPNPVTDQLIIE